MPLPAAYNVAPKGVELPTETPPVTANQLAYVEATAEQIKAQKMRNELAQQEVADQKEKQNILAKYWEGGQPPAQGGQPPAQGGQPPAQGNPLGAQPTDTSAPAQPGYAKTPKEALELYTGKDATPAEPDKKYQIQVPGRPTTEWLHEQVKAGAIHPAAAYQLDQETTAMKVKMADGYIKQAEAYAGVIKDDMVGAVESGDKEAVARILKGAKDMFPDNPIIQRKADDALASIAKGTMPSAGGKEPAGDDANARKMYEARLRESNPGMSMAEIRGRAAEMVEDAKAKRAEGRIESGIGAREEAAQRKEGREADLMDKRQEYYTTDSKGQQLVDSFILNPIVKTNIPARDRTESAAFRQAVALREEELGGAGKVAQIRTDVASDTASRKKTQTAADATHGFIETMDLNMNQLDGHIKDMTKRLNLDHARLLNMPVREFESKVKGSSDISIYDMLTSSIGKEAGKLMQGGAQSVAPLAEGASKEMKDIYDKNLPVSEMVKLLKATRKEGGNRDTAYENTLTREDKRIASYLPAWGGGGKKSAELAPTNDKGWKLMQDAKGNTAYVSPDGKQFEEAK